MFTMVFDGCEPLIKRRDGDSGPVTAIAFHDHATGILVEIACPPIVQKVLVTEFQSSGSLTVATEMPPKGFAPGENGRKP